MSFNIHATYTIDIYGPCMPKAIYVTYIERIYAHLHVRMSGQYK